ncbi:MAG: cytochrome b/b6 domain-containing protein [Pseudomonadota bacterium]
MKSSAPTSPDDGAQSPAAASVPLPVWDLPVRLFHWVLVLLLAVSWMTGRDGGIDAMTWHLRAGLAVLALLLARIAWGVIGSQTARFREFVRGPRAAWADARALLRRTTPPHAGHPPLGGWMVVALLIARLVQCATGEYANDAVMTEGPLAGRVSPALGEWLSTIHRWNVNVLLALAAVHVAAVVYHIVAMRSDLLLGMITGRRRLPALAQPPRMRSAWLALALLITAAALLWPLYG